MWKCTIRCDSLLSISCLIWIYLAKWAHVSSLSLIRRIIFVTILHEELYFITFDNTPIHSINKVPCI